MIDQTNIKYDKKNLIQRILIVTLYPKKPQVPIPYQVQKLSKKITNTKCGRFEIYIEVLAREMSGMKREVMIKLSLADYIFFGHPKS
jgi:hypothetical protein